uniref:Uncharacterized protein n=1 Tax=Nelumbo nucifera TaxID=4432 RepID=A0A822XVS1_NELNU|nr:TPA_asm: hypothetical protein HUJ06_022991 [Nelumbo nucifera]
MAIENKNFLPGAEEEKERLMNRKLEERSRDYWQTGNTSSVSAGAVFVAGVLAISSDVEV